MSIRKMIAEAGIILGETLLVTAANYVTNTCIDMYAHPDLKDCNSDEEKQAKIQKFKKTMNIVKPVACVLEAGLIGAGAGFAIEAVDRSGKVAAATTNDSSEEKTSNESTALIGCNYLI